ncbi:hypothetical protein CYMTET_22632 [Cymbomonas tetramitiformis]|uniref:Uncharacterized protein n=1 Tax=Cymbomonas tetramitiformis TaxID=36881 RepID=A0AAE0FZI8_9CHLO|nr:hypothetical protein CYMTET_22632 [Cymbomonas tetramitiformis]
MDPNDPQFHHPSTPYSVYTTTPPPFTPHSIPAPPQYDPRVTYGQPALIYPPFTVAPPPHHAQTRSTQFGWSHPIYNGNSWEAPARAPHYPVNTPTLQPARPFFSAPPPTAPALGPQRLPPSPLYTPEHRPLFQGVSADAWYEPSVEEYAQRLESTWREWPQPDGSQPPAGGAGAWAQPEESQPHSGIIGAWAQPEGSQQPTSGVGAWVQPEGSQHPAGSMGVHAGDQSLQRSPVPSGMLEAIVDGPVTYSNVAATAAPLAVPSSSPAVSHSRNLETIVNGLAAYSGTGSSTAAAAAPAPSSPSSASRRQSLSALLPPEPASRGIPVRYSHMGTLATEAGGRSQTAWGRHARRSSGPDTLRRHLPPRSDPPSARSSSGSESDRDSPRSRHRRTRARAVRRDNNRNRSGGRRSDEESDLSLAALRRSIMEEVRGEIRAEMMGQPPQGTGGIPTTPVTPQGDSPETGRVNATRGVTWHADTRDNEHTGSTSRTRQRQLARRRRSSLDSVMIDGGGNSGDSSPERGQPPRGGSDSGSPARWIADPDDDDDNLEVRALLITVDGGSLWVP